MRDIDEIRHKKKAIQDVRDRLVQEKRYDQALQLTLKIEALLWVLGSDWNERWYETEGKHAGEINGTEGTS